MNGQVTSLWIGSLYEEKDGQILCHVYAGSRLVATFEPKSGFACFIQHHPDLAAIWNFGYGRGRAPLSIMSLAILVGGYFDLRTEDRRWRTAKATLRHPFPVFRLLAAVLNDGSLSGISSPAFGVGFRECGVVFAFPSNRSRLGSSQLIWNEVLRHFRYLRESSFEDGRCDSSVGSSRAAEIFCGVSDFVIYIDGARTAVIYEVAWRRRPRQINVTTG